MPLTDPFFKEMFQTRVNTYPYIHRLQATTVADEDNCTMLEIHVSEVEHCVNKNMVLWCLKYIKNVRSPDTLLIYSAFKCHDLELIWTNLGHGDTSGLWIPEVQNVQVDERYHAPCTRHFSWNRQDRPIVGMSKLM